MRKKINLSMTVFSLFIIFFSVSCYKGQDVPSRPGAIIPVLLPAPSDAGLSATNGTYKDKIVITWAAVPGASKYNIYRCEAPADGNCDAQGLDYVKIATVNAPQTYYEDTTALAGVKYCYKVSAVDSQNVEGEKSKGVLGVRVSDYPLSVPIGWQDSSTASNGTYTDRVHLEWSDVTGADGYEIFRCEASSGVCSPTAHYDKIADIAIAAINRNPLNNKIYYDDYNIQAGKIYCYIIKAYKFTGNPLSPKEYSDGTNPVQGGIVSTYTQQKPADSTLGVDSGNTYPIRLGSVKFVFGKVTGAERYYIYRADGIITSYYFERRVVKISGTGAETIPDISQYASYPAQDVFFDSANNKYVYYDSLVQFHISYFYKVQSWTAANGFSEATTPVEAKLPEGSQILSAPATFTAEDGVNLDKVVLNWAAVSGATSYTLQRFNSDCSTGVQTVGSAKITGITVQDTGLDEGTKYCYSIQAFDDNGNYSPAVTDLGYRKLSAPQSVSAVKGSSESSVVVSGYTHPMATQYKIYRTTYNGTVCGGSYSEIAQTSSLTYSDTSASMGTMYCYKAQAVSANTGSSDLSTVWDFGFKKVPAPATITASEGTSTTQINISWSSVTGATGYKLYRSDNYTTPLQLLDSTTYSYTDNSPLQGQLNVYRVKAVVSTYSSNNDSDFSVDSNGGYMSLALPASITASDGTSTSQIAVSWGAVTGATGYKLYCDRDSFTNPIYTGATASYNDAAGVSGRTYTYKVKAYNAVGESAMSDVSDTGYIQLSAPTGVTAVESGSNLRVSWTAPTGDISSYDIYRAPENSSGVEGTYVLLDPNSYSVVSAVSVDDNSAPWGEKFYYKIVAKNASSGAESAMSLAGSGKRTTVTEGAYKALGTSGFSAAAGKYTSIQFYQGIAYIAYNQPSDNKIFVKKYDKINGWVNVGDIAVTDAHSYAMTRIAVKSSTEIYVAYGNTSDLIKMKKGVYSTGSWSWTDVSPSSSTGYNSGGVHYSYLTLSLSASGIPYIAFRNNLNKIIVKSYNGSWSDVGTGGEAGSGYTGTGGSYLALYVKGETPYVAYTDSTLSMTTFTYHLFLKSYNGSSWTSVGTVATDPDYSSGAYVNLFVVDASTIYTSFRKSADSKIHVVKWNGASMTDIGSTSETATRNSLKVVDGVVYLGYQVTTTNKAKIIKYKSSWANVGGTNGDGIVGSIVSDVTYSFLSIDFYNGSIYAAYTDSDYSGKVTVKY